MADAGKDSSRKAMLVCTLAFTHSGLFYALGVILARLLGPVGFGDYSVAVSIAHSRTSSDSRTRAACRRSGSALAACGISMWTARIAVTVE